jgi:hypothetical protein
MLEDHSKVQALMAEINYHHQLQELPLPQAHLRLQEQAAEEQLRLQHQAQVRVRVQENLQHQG